MVAEVEPAWRPRRPGWGAHFGGRPCPGSRAMRHATEPLHHYDRPDGRKAPCHKGIFWFRRRRCHPRAPLRRQARRSSGRLRFAAPALASPDPQTRISGARPDAFRSPSRADLGQQMRPHQGNQAIVPLRILRAEQRFFGLDARLRKPPGAPLAPSRASHRRSGPRPARRDRRARPGSPGQGRAAALRSGRARAARHGPRLDNQVSRRA